MKYLLRHGEIALKSRPVRSRFERRLLSNIKDMMLREGVEGLLTREADRMFLVARHGDAGVCERILTHTFGLVSFSRVSVSTSSDLDEICESALRIASRWGGGRFAVRCRRVGTHPYTSMGAAAYVGERILSSCQGLEVDLEGPEHELFVEIRGRQAYLYERSVPCPGGLPVGSEGRCACIVENERDALAVWLVMKRGCLPHLGGDRGVVERCLLNWLPRLHFHEATDARMLATRADRILISSERDPSRMVRPDGVTVFYPLAALTDDDLHMLMSAMLGDPRNVGGLMPAV